MYIKYIKSLNLLTVENNLWVNTKFTKDSQGMNNSLQPLPMVLLSVRGGWT